MGYSSTIIDGRRSPIEFSDTTGLLLAIAVWSFCRLYYFAFYVIENYVDDSYRFSGLWSFVKYLWNRRSD